jgi:G3E family GTPase
MVDAKHADLQLDEHHEAQVQVAFADRILITKRAKSSLASGRD